MINTVFEILVLKSIGISLLLVLIMALRPAILRWSTPNVAYSLWLMLPIYLLLPINFVEATSTGAMMTFFLGANTLAVNLDQEKLIGENWIELLSVTVWLVGFIAGLLMFYWRYRQLTRSLIQVDSSVLAKRSDNLETSQLAHSQLVTSRLIDVPAVFGLIKSYLILPHNFEQQPNQNQQIILAHELYHLNRHDHRFNILRVMVKSIFWFNPMFYWADKYVEADQEMSCDLGVLQNAKLDQRKIYAKVLLESAVGLGQNKLVSQWKYQSLIKERVKMLKNNQVKKWHSWVAAVFAASAIWVTSGVVMAEKEGVADKGAIPISIIQPRYPREAAVEGIEGWVKFGFDLDSNGSPLNIKVLAAQPKGVFEDVSWKVIKKWKFKVTKAQKNLIYTMEFMLEEPDSEE